MRAYTYIFTYIYTQTEYRSKYIYRGMKLMGVQFVYRHPYCIFHVYPYKNYQIILHIIWYARGSFR